MCTKKKSLLADRVDRRVQRDHDERDPEPEDEPPPAAAPASRAARACACAARTAAPRRGSARAAAARGSSQRDGGGDRHGQVSRTARSPSASERPQSRDAPLPLPPRHERGARPRGAVRRQARLRARRPPRADRREQRHGRGRDVGWEELDAQGFMLRLSELERGAVNVVLQPGHWRLPRVDHLGVALDEDDFEAVLSAPPAGTCRCRSRRPADVRLHERGLPARAAPASRLGRRAARGRRRAAARELQLATDEPEAKAAALADILGLELDGDRSQVGETVVRFVPAGPEGRPELFAERSSERARA